MYGNPLFLMVKTMVSGEDFPLKPEHYYHLVMTNIAMENPPIFKFGKPSISMGSTCHFARPWTRWTRSASTHAAPSRAPGHRWPSAGGPGLFGPAGGGGRVFHPLGSWCPPQLYPLVMADIAMVKPWPIEIDGLPNLEMVRFSMAMLVITRW